MMMACSRVSSMSVRAVITDHSSGVQGSACGVVVVPGSKTPFVEARCLPVPGTGSKTPGGAGTGKMTPGGAGTHKGHTRDTRFTQTNLTTIPHNHPSQPSRVPDPAACTNAHTHNRRSPNRATSPDSRPNPGTHVRRHKPPHTTWHRGTPLTRSSAVVVTVKATAPRQGSSEDRPRVLVRVSDCPCVPYGVKCVMCTLGHTDTVSDTHKLETARE